MWLQGLELLVTVLLAGNRKPPSPVAAGVPHAELAAELITLPSGLLAMVCEAIVKLKVRLGCVRALSLRRPSQWGRRSPGALHSACQRRVRGSTHSPRGLVPPWRSAGSTATSTVLCRFRM